MVYEPPASDVRTRPVYEDLIKQQSIASGIIGGLIGAFLAIVLLVFSQYFGFRQNVFYFLVVGFFVGIFVRYTGRGFEFKFRAISSAITFFICIGLSGAFEFRIGFFGLLSLLLSVGIAGSVATRTLTPQQQQALWQQRQDIPENIKRRKK